MRDRIELPAAARQFGGLLAASRPLTEAAGQWERGVVFAGRGCAEPAMRGPCDNEFSTGAPVEDDPTSPTGPWSFTPTTVRQGTSCTTLSRFPAGEMSEARLNVAREWAAGHILQTGDHTTHDTPDGQTDNPALIDGTDLGTDILILDAVACAEQAAADNLFGAPAYLHASPLLATHMLAAQVMWRDGRLWRTAAGSIVVVSPGYTGTDLYVTGEVFTATGMRQVNAEPVGTVDRVDNTHIAWANELVLAVFDACWHGVVTVDATDCTTAT